MFSTGEFSRLARVSKRLLQFYDEEGLLRPAVTDPRTGYRKYRAAQLRELNRILALRELGLSLREIHDALKKTPSDQQLVGLLAKRKGEIESSLRADLRRLKAIEARFSDGSLPDVVVKPVPGVPALAARAHLETSGQAWPWVLSVASAMRKLLRINSLSGLTLTMPGDGFENSDFALQASFPLREPFGGASGDLFATTLPELPAAATVVQTGGPDLLHRGCAAIAGWVESNGYRIVGPPREVILTSAMVESCDDLVMEAQFPIERDC